MYLVLIAMLGLALAGSAAPALAQSPAPPDQVSVAPQPVECDARATPRPCADAKPAAPRRRAVPLTIERMPPSSPPPAPGYRPALPPAPAPANTAPQPLVGCDAGACRDAAGTQYHGGVGNATLDPNGRLCHRDGAWLQCF
jgi:hypothetical protein